MAEKGARVIIITKKVKGHSAHHGGAWKVAYADFVTALMALFMVLWLVSQTDADTKEKLSEYFRTGVLSGAPSILVGGPSVANGGYQDSQTGMFRSEQSSLIDTATKVKSALGSVAGSDREMAALIQQMDIQVTDDGLLIQILDGSEELLFQLSSAELKPKLRRILELIAPILGALENPIQIHGHTDARPFPAGANRTNWDLSFARADSARQILDDKGLRPGQISGVFAHGSSQPYVRDDPFSPRNRRLAILAVRRIRENVVSRAAPGRSSPDPVQNSTDTVQLPPMALQKTAAQAKIDAAKAQPSPTL